MRPGRLQVLGDGQQLDPDRAQVGHGLEDLVALLAHAQDQVRLGRAALGQPRPGPGQQLQRPGVGEPGPDPLVQPGHGLDVVAQHVRLDLGDLAQRLRLAAEVGDQHLDPAGGQQGPDLADRLGEQPGAAVVQVVAGHPGDDREPQAHAADGVGDPARLVGVVALGLARVDLAERAGPGAVVPADQEGGLPGLPALVDVGAAGLLAHRVQLLVADQALELAVVRALGRLDLQPGRLAGEGGVGRRRRRGAGQHPQGADPGRDHGLRHGRSPGRSPPPAGPG